ncbi:MAG: hypothetical protein ABIY55_02330 [Kofleriaceae bacterium]
MLRRLDPYLAVDAMTVHHIELAHTCWLARTPEGGLKGCAIGALFYAQYGDVPLDPVDLIQWASEFTGSRAYVQGFDAAFHEFPADADPTQEYALGLADGQHTRGLIEEPHANHPALWCWQDTEKP